MRTKVIRESIQEGDNVFSIVLIETANSYIVLLSEGEEKLGTLAVALPQKTGIIRPSISSILLGDRNTALVRLLAEHLTRSLNRMVLVSVSLKTLDERNARSTFFKLLEKTLKNDYPI